VPLQRLERYNTLERINTRFGRGSKEAEYLGLRAWNIARFEDDFMGDQMKYDATAPGTYQSTASGAAAATAAISTGVVNGAALLDAGTDNAGRSDLSLGRHYRGDRKALYVALLSINSITTRKFEVMFTDVLSGTDAGAVDTKATPTFNATDCVGWVYDTADDSRLTLVGNKNGTAATVVDVSTDIFTIAANTYYYFGVQLDGDNAYGFILDANGRKLTKDNDTVIIDAVSEDVLLTPWLFVQNRAANAGSMTVDWHMAQQFRTPTV